MFGGLDLVIGIRLHSLIVAATQGVPFFALSYDTKTDNFVEEMETSSYSLPIEEMDAKEAVSRIDELLSQKDQVERGVADRVSLMVDRAKLNFDLLEAFMAGRGA